MALKSWNYNFEHSWKNRCRKTVQSVNKVGFNHIPNAETLIRWYIAFLNTTYFPHSQPAFHLRDVGKVPQPEDEDQSVLFGQSCKVDAWYGLQWNYLYHSTLNLWTMEGTIGSKLFFPQCIIVVDGIVTHHHLCCTKDSFGCTIWPTCRPQWFGSGCATLVILTMRQESCTMLTATNDPMLSSCISTTAKRIYWSTVSLSAVEMHGFRPGIQDSRGCKAVW